MSRSHEGHEGHTVRSDFISGDKTGVEDGKNNNRTSRERRESRENGESTERAEKSIKRAERVHGNGKGEHRARSKSKAQEKSGQAGQRQERGSMEYGQVQYILVPDDI